MRGPPSCTPTLSREWGAYIPHKQRTCALSLAYSMLAAVRAALWMRYQVLSSSKQGRLVVCPCSQPLLPAYMLGLHCGPAGCIPPRILHVCSPRPHIRVEQCQPHNHTEYACAQPLAGNLPGSGANCPFKSQKPINTRAPSHRRQPLLFATGSVRMCTCSQGSDGSPAIVGHTRDWVAASSPELGCSLGRAMYSALEEAATHTHKKDNTGDVSPEDKRGKTLGTADTGVR